YLLGAAGSACLAAAGAAGLAGQPVRLPVAGWLGAGTGNLVADSLASLFVVIAFGPAFAVSLAFASWAVRPGAVGRRGLGASYALTLGAVAVFLTAQDAFTALLAWESLTVAFYLLVGFERGRAGRPAGALVTLAFGQISGAALLLGLLLLAVRSGSLDLASFAQVPPGVARDAAQALLITGFAVKVGLVPFQIWLPRGYAAAPGPARAIMGGIAVNVGFYGLWRTLALLGPPPAWLTGTLLVLAGLTALLGIAHAAVQPRLQRVIAYSSVENSGLILAGYGVALVGAATHDARLVAAGLLAGTLQIVAHAAAKSLLFTSSSIVTVPVEGERWTGADDDLDALRGSARRQPWAGTGLAIGSLTLAGLPLTVGFVSEWFLLEALLQQFRVPELGYRLLLAIAGAAVALTAGFAGVTFVRLIGLVVLGPPSRGTGSQPPSKLWDGGWLGRAGIVILSACCLATAALLPLVIRVIAAGLSSIVAAPVVNGARQSPWVLGPVFSGFSVLSPSWLWIIMPSMALVVLAVARLLSGARLTQVRRVPVWRSATAGVEGADSYTATGFANPTRRVLSAVLPTRAAVQPPDQPEAGGSDVIEVVETYLYRPMLVPLRAVVRTVKRLQSGRLDAYLAYMLVALVALLALVVALA
ncbi:MAG TPA: proton-conducting transporter membrane subunit, partial [Streptosporangiaceae bacterium]|nr:proton-conducting transporter membrane subunit [Streptosporangiaceae bacterium]